MIETTEQHTRRRNCQCPTLGARVVTGKPLRFSKKTMASAPSHGCWQSWAASCTFGPLHRAKRPATAKAGDRGAVEDWPTLRNLTRWESLASRAGAIQMAHCRCPRTMAACSVRACGTRKPDGLSGPLPPKRRPKESRCPRRRTSDVPGSPAI